MQVVPLGANSQNHKQFSEGSKKGCQQVNLYQVEAISTGKLREAVFICASELFHMRDERVISYSGALFLYSSL